LRFHELLIFPWLETYKVRNLGMKNPEEDLIGEN